MPKRPVILVFLSILLCDANLEHWKQKIEEYNQALRINPNLASAYLQRGFIYIELGDKHRALTDLQKAADLFRQQGSTKSYQKTLEIMRQVQ